jgi:hypothetical protein
MAFKQHVHQAPIAILFPCSVQDHCVLPVFIAQLDLQADNNKRVQTGQHATSTARKVLNK